MKHINRLISFIICIILLISSTACSSASSNIRRKVVMSSIPTTFDPQMVSTDEQHIIVRNCFEGLFRATGGAIEKACCESYSVSDDSLTYTFKIKSGLAWSDQSAITADDFVFGIIRALSPETETNSASLLFSIKNAEKFYKGKASEKDLGILATSADTLIITLDTADDELIQKLSYSFAMPCKRDFFYSAKGRYCMSKSTSLFNGPLYISSWDTDNSTLKISKNDNYAGQFVSKVNSVSFAYNNDAKQRIADVTDADYDLTFINCDGNTTIEGSAQSDRITNCSWAVFINPNLSSAISDKKVANSLKTTLTMQSYQDSLPFGFNSSCNIIPDNLMLNGTSYSVYGHNTSVYKTDQTLGRQQFVEALKKYNSKFPECALLYVDNEGMKSLAKAIVSTWQTQLGAYINIKGVSQSEMKQLIARGEYQLALYPLSDSSCSAVSFVEQFHSQSSNNIYSVNDKKIDKYISSGKTYRKIDTIEKRLINNPYIIPVAQSSLYFVTSDKLTDINADGYQGHIDLFNLN